MDWLETPNEDFGGFPVCPFLAPERKQDKLHIEFYDYRKGSLFEMIGDFDKDDRYTTALYLHLRGGQHLKSKDYGDFVTKVLKSYELGHLKAVCFSPFEKLSKNGVKTREQAPCFITSITTHEALHDAWKKITKTKYWQNNQK